MEILVVSGFDEESMYTSYYDLTTGDEIHLPLYNSSYIVALPKYGKT